MSVVVSIPGNRRRAWWVDHLQSLLPDWDIRNSDDPGPVEAVRYVVVWKPRPGWMAGFPGLRAIVSIGAGIDHVLADPECPPQLPIIKTTGPDLVQRMCEYVALQVLRLHRDLPALQQAQAEARWAPAIVPPASRRRVGIMGLGRLGSACAGTLLSLGFQVSGWSRSGSRLDGLRSHAGDAQLAAFLADCDILVCLLPLTPATRHCLNARLFAQLPRGASLINVARGEHLVEDDLLQALDSGQLARATLDVFEREPLPPEHLFWSHPQVLVTPHIASLIDPEAGGQIIADNLQRFEAHGRVDDQADRERGY